MRLELFRTVKYQLHLESDQKTLVARHRQAARRIRHWPHGDCAIIRVDPLDPVHAEVGNVKAAVFRGGGHVVPVVAVETWKGQTVLEGEARRRTDDVIDLDLVAVSTS